MPTPLRRAGWVAAGLAAVALLAGCEEKPIFQIEQQGLMEAIADDNRDAIDEWTYVGIDLNEPRPFAHPYFGDRNPRPMTPLLAAIMVQNEPIVQKLLRAGADGNRPGTFAHPGLGRGRVVTAAPLFAAAVTREGRIVGQLLRKGARVDGRAGGEALAGAIIAGRPGILELLLRAGADPDRPGPFVHRGLFGGRPVEIPPLVAVSALGEVRLIEVLVKGGAGVRGRVGGEALCSGVRYGRVHSVEALLKAGAPVDARCEDGRSPLRLAREGGHGPVVKVLVEAGARESP